MHKAIAWKAVLFSVALAAVVIVARNAGGLLGTSWSPLLTVRGRAFEMLLVGGCFSLVLYGIHLFYRPFLDNPRLPRYAVLLCLFGACATILFLLPPFQGPDEIMHWKFALAYCRQDGMQDPAYELPEQLKAGDLPFRTDQHQDASLFRQPPQTGLTPALPIEYGYVRWYSYPLVAAVASVYPRTATMGEALQFYYLCRLVPMVVLLLLLLWACRRCHVPYTALMFFSLPIFLQQCCAISTDNLLIPGTVAATLLFLHLWRKPNLPLTVLLWVLCVLMALSKYIVGGVLLFPLMLLPYRRIPRKNIVVPAAAVVVAGLMVFLIPHVFDSLRATHGHYGSAQVEAQIARLTTWSGCQALIHMYLSMCKKLWGLDCWSYSMGWLDTNLSALHLVLIRVSFIAAVLLDLCQFGPQLRLVWRECRREVLLVAGLIGANLFANTFGVALAYFIIGVEPGGLAIHHWQVRHFFSGLTVLVLLPALLGDCRAAAKQMNRQEAKSGQDRQGEKGAPVQEVLGALGGPRRLGGEESCLPALLGAVALGVLPLLLFARNVELAIDLLTRYW